jgi:hypothetical protein
MNNEDQDDNVPVVKLRKPDTVEYVVSESDKKALKYIRNDGYMRTLLENTLKRFNLTELSSNQIVIIKRVGVKASSYGPVDTVKLIKPSQKMHYRLAPETTNAEFLIEVDAANFDYLDQDVQELELFDQLSRIFLDTDRDKYVIQKLIRVNLALVREKGLDNPEARAVVRNIELSDLKKNDA